MTVKEMQTIAATARRLIALLNECDDKDFVEEVVSCVKDGQVCPSIDAGFILRSNKER